MVNPSSSLNSLLRREVMVGSEHLKRDAIRFDPGNGHYAQTVRFYERLPIVYDYLYPDHLQYSDRLFRHLSPILRANAVRNILDASCGIGHDISCLAKYGFHADGVDACEAMIDEAQRRLIQHGVSDAALRVGDVRSIEVSAPKPPYDLVIFRGNTLSNIHPDDLAPALAGLVSIVKPGGLMLLDYRDGNEQLHVAKRFEQRGFGYDRVRATAFQSFYWLSHTKSLGEPYLVDAIVCRANARSGVSVDRFKIRSYYVNSDLLTAGLRRLPVTILPLALNSGNGLPYLRTLLLRRG